MVTLVNRAKVSTSTTGTGTLTLGAAADGYQAFGAAGVTDGDVVRYVIEDGSNWEIGTGTYTASGTTLSRTVSESSNADAAINLSGTATVFVGAAAEDLAQAGPSLQAIASGSLSDGSTVVINADGTVSVTTATSTPESAGTATQFTTGFTASYVAAVYVPNVDRLMVIVNQYVYIGDISGSSITFQSPTTYEGTANFVNAACDPISGQVLMLWRNGSGEAQAMLATIPATGNSVSYGSNLLFDSNGIEDTAIAYDTANQKFVVVYADRYVSSFYGTALVGTVSGNSISFGTKVIFRSGRTDDTFACVYDAASGKIVVGYKEVAGTNNLTAVVGTVSGTSISFGSAVAFASNGGYTKGVYDSGAQKTVLIYKNGLGGARVGTVSGTSISFGTEATFGTNPAFLSVVYDTTAQKVVVSYNENYATTEMQSAKISGTSITFDAPLEVSNSVYTERLSSAYDPDTGKTILTYKDVGNGNNGYYVVYSAGYVETNLTAQNFIGFSDAAYADTDTATIQLVGAVDDAQTGLTAGQKYYVQVDGSLSTTPDAPEVYAGVAVASNKIIVKG